MLLVQGPHLFLTSFPSILPALSSHRECSIRSIFHCFKASVPRCLMSFSPALWERKMLLAPALSDLSPFPLSGQLCETPPRPPAPRNPCEGTECQNGANCVDQGNGPVCQCLPGFGGPECEKLLSVNFVDRDTYLQFTDLQNWPRANITLQVCAQGTQS